MFFHFFMMYTDKNLVSFYGLQKKKYSNQEKDEMKDHHLFPNHIFSFPTSRIKALRIGWLSVIN